ncbi:MAG TPA: multicopper oxidase domain-containing protein [Gaiellaceae bacterium]|nr:multicopper oxidase domain-containing protein [Gaiellaceae bacterium]
MAYQATPGKPVRPAQYEPAAASGALPKLVALLLGIAVGVLIPVAIWLGVSAQNARDDAKKAAASAGRAPAASMPGMSQTTATAGVATPSFAGIAPADADAIAARHAAFPASLPAAPAGPVANVRLSINHRTVSIAPGIRYEAWTFGDTAPGPVIHVRQGQLVKVTLHNSSPMPHSVDFHAAQVAPNVAFADVLPGASKTFSFVAKVPGVFMYHCGTAPAFMHIANGMYGAIVVEPAGMPKADREYVLVSGEWYLDKPGLATPASLDLTKAEQMTPDWVTWNGYAGQYKTHPLTAQPGQTVRFWVVDAGPSLNTEFHVVGTVLERAWLNGDLVDAPQHDIQTAVVPAGGGGVFDVRIPIRGIYPFVSHSFASVQLGEVGLLNVGGVPGTMSH